MQLFRVLRKYLNQRLLEGQCGFGTYDGSSDVSKQSKTSVKMIPDVSKKAVIDSPTSGSSNHRRSRVMANQNQVST